LPLQRQWILNRFLIGDLIPIRLGGAIGLESFRGFLLALEL